MSELPTNWEATPLSRVCERIVDGSHNPPKAAAAGYPMLSARNIQDRKINFGEYRLISESDFQIEHQRTSIRPGDVLMTIVGTIGRTAVVSDDIKPFALQRSVAVLRAQELDSQYLSYALEAPLIQKALADNAKGTAQKGVYLKTLGAIEIPLAPLPEQKRIADKLDTVLARVDACRDRLDRLPALLKRFRQSILAAATSGQLTEEWRKSSELIGWNTVAIKSICHSITDGDHQAPPQAETGIPFITISAFNNGRLSLSKASRFVPRSYFEGLNATRRPAYGDILYSVTGSIGIPALVDTDLEFTFQRHVAILKPNTDFISSAYLLYALGSEQSRLQAHEVATGTAQLTIPLNGLRAFTIGLPPTSEQTEIVRRVEILFAFADRLEARLATARKQVEQLTPALLANAFRGELVPQDPADEPASELLKRLAAAGQDSPPKARRGKVRAGA